MTGNILWHSTEKKCLDFNIISKIVIKYIESAKRVKDPQLPFAQGLYSL